MVSMMRSKYYEYSEYHTSHDDLERVVSAAGLAGGFEAIRQALEILEQDVYPTALVRGEPMLSARGLYSTLGAGRYSSSPQKLLDIWSFCDGSLSTLDIATRLCLSFVEVREVVDTLLKHELVQVVPRLIQ
jgi:aminopeptidase-like protein